MAKFRRREFEVDAYQVTEKTAVQTFRGERVAHPGDWVLCGSDGEKWIVPDLIFRSLYEPADRDGMIRFSDLRSNENEEDRDG